MFEQNARSPFLAVAIVGPKNYFVPLISARLKCLLPFLDIVGLINGDGRKV